MSDKSGKTSMVRPFTPELVMDLLSKTGLREGEKVWIVMEPGHISIRRDPVAELWGALATSQPKSPRQLIDEAMEAQFGLADDEEA